MRFDFERIGGLIAAADVAADGHERAAVEQQLGALGVQCLSVSPGAVFDPTVHRAVARVPAPSPGQVNTIAATVRPGWRCADRILRYVEVRVFVAASHCPSAGGTS
ncbi:nucleotide exchange factor GrpE (plasmid) [Rhodococcus pyridinivorans]|uniref:nucleotide exchange factor GrpE n=1 Tax=Rhodococcus TaxID=1827 RepID=UPI00110ED70D|nr:MULTISPECIES: nucleotide exchange factor GrpE [Rhodococcus]MBX4171945.1 nucleotide exchange factor GrpE [Rhodococcus sp. DMU2021]QXF83986.1 nucleotide exchange factor GrpE [Rhodococcus pyridinivorans]